MYHINYLKFIYIWFFDWYCLNILYLVFSEGSVYELFLNPLCSGGCNFVNHTHPKKMKSFL